MPRVGVEPANATKQQAELGGMTLRALQKEAERLKVGDAELDEAEDKAAVIALIEAARAAQPEADEAYEAEHAAEAAAAAPAAERAEPDPLAQLEAELAGTKLRALQRRAAELGVDDAALDAADGDKQAVIALIRELVCPNPAVTLDRWLTDPETGEPRLLFRVACAWTFVFAATFCCGLFFTPSLADIYQLEDPPLFGAAITAAVFLGPVGLVPILAEVRAVCRCHGEGALLPQLGAGVALLSAERRAGLRKYAGLADARGWFQWGLRILSVLAFGTFVVSGWGVHPSWHNRVSAAVVLVEMVLTIPTGVTFVGTLHVATELIGAKIDAITEALKQERRGHESGKGRDMTDEQWNEAVAEPIRELIGDLELLSRGWARGTLAITLVAAALTFAFVCATLSPAVGPWAVEQSGHTWADTGLDVLFAGGAVVCVSMPLLILDAPAHVSTSCDDLKEALNSVRISDLDNKRIHDRLRITEAAMANVNHGQGVGFVLFHFVIDKRALGLIAVKLGAAGSAAFTAFLTYSAYSIGAIAAGEASPCDLSAAEVDMVQSVLRQRNATCAYNVSLDEVLGM